VYAELFYIIYELDCDWDYYISEIQGIHDQIIARQNAIITRTPNAIQYLNSRNAWIRMCSSVNVGDDAGALAKSYVLLGGTLYKFKTVFKSVGILN